MEKKRKAEAKRARKKGVVRDSFGRAATDADDLTTGEQPVDGETPESGDEPTPVVENQ